MESEDSMAFCRVTNIWEHGRQLATLEQDEVTWNFTYNADGIRTKRTTCAACTGSTTCEACGEGTSNATTYSYVYNGSSLSQMTVGENKLNFLYDANGAPMVVIYNGEVYYYVTNLQGDVIAILDSTGTAVVEYNYDAWGKLLATTGTLAATIGLHNPLRYRAYVYDPESALYYLQSRYYDPELGRFINADEYPSTGQGLTGNNMFAYCGNNPVSREDNEGKFWHLAVGAAIGVATQYISDVVTNLSSGKSFQESLHPTSTLADYASAAISGALAASGAGLGLSIAANAALGGTTYLANCAIAGKDANGMDFCMAIGIGAISGAVGGSGADGARLRGIVDTSKYVLKNSLSPKKIAMYTGKMVNVAKTVIVSTVRTMAAGFSSNYLNSKRREVTASVI